MVVLPTIGFEPAVPVVPVDGPAASAAADAPSAASTWQEPALPGLDDAGPAPAVDAETTDVITFEARQSAADEAQPTPGPAGPAGPGQAAAAAPARVAPAEPAFARPGARPASQQAPFVQQPGLHAAPPAGQFQAQHHPAAQVNRPPVPTAFNPALQRPGAQHATASSAGRPAEQAPSAPMATASSSFNRQIRPAAEAAVRVDGWRAWVRRMGIDIGPSARDQAQSELVHRIRVAKNKFHVTGVFSDSAGGTLLVGALGQILERTRADNVVALDLDPDGGDLDQVTAWHQGGSTARTLIQQTDLSDRNQVDKHLAVTATNLHVLPSPWRFNGDDVADYDDVLDLYSIFRPHYSLALVDAGRGLQTPTGAGVLEISSALILPASATTRGVRKAAATIDWLRHHGWHGLLANTIVVINHTKRKGSVSVEQFEELFRAGQKLRVHEIPYDPHLDADVPIDLELLNKQTVRALEELAADLADGFNSGYEPPAAVKLAELHPRVAEGR
ncbi:hypothetical protein [Tsukamurella pseudospumae]|uniref:AAA domain-containing protein n=1 Tax=Tsukamurella pseudospumae TaxID=239498 RepID=A0A137ZMN9_9ACTN|nr:hypothetical protein [Tsukamurella pseudospumae]KXO99433.1 hypothetical protein AXK61_16420 [Tsukamurella pseudospumae]